MIAHGGMGGQADVPPRCRSSTARSALEGAEEIQSDKSLIASNADHRNHHFEPRFELLRPGS